MYVVNELTILADNHFEIYNTCHLVTDDLEVARTKARELIQTASNDFSGAEIKTSEGEMQFYVSRTDDYDRIEINIDEIEYKSN